MLLVSVYPRPGANSNHNPEDCPRYRDSQATSASPDIALKRILCQPYQESKEQQLQAHRLDSLVEERTAGDHHHLEPEQGSKNLARQLSGETVGNRSLTTTTARLRREPVRRPRPGFPFPGLAGSLR